MVSCPNDGLFPADTIFPLFNSSEKGMIFESRDSLHAISRHAMRQAGKCIQVP